MPPESSTQTTPPERECDVVMKGGITSGVLYPSALVAIGDRYRIRGIGGASAGAIGAALGAAAEFGRASGGYQRLSTLPNELGDGQLAALFQPQPRTRPMLRLMLAATGNDRPTSGAPASARSRIWSIISALVRAFPIACVVGAAPGAVVVVVGAQASGWTRVVMIATGVVLLVFGLVVAMLWRVWRKLTVDIPANLFGICRGIKVESSPGPGFTDWLADRIDDIAGLDTKARPLRFGQLWTASDQGASVEPPQRQGDLRMITTCLSEARPYELPWAANRFFYDPREWRTLFPARVVDALEREVSTEGDSVEPTDDTTTDDPGDLDTLRWEEALAASHDPPLRRLPAAEHLPVIVATRMSLSFPLLISAIPMWIIDRRSPATRQAADAFRAATRAKTPPPTEGLAFKQAWFTDGGLCSNFPVQMFDAALPSRPTFAINLGRFPADRVPDADQRNNIEWAHNNSSGLLPTFSDLPTRGVAAVAGFASAALNTARNWTDSTNLEHPGYRDRIVRILQTKREGGLNLYMTGPTIDELAKRGAAAGEAITEQFIDLHYPTRSPRATGWDNHRWVRYRALLSVLPMWINSYARGKAVLDITDPPSYPLTVKAQKLADDLAASLDAMHSTLVAAGPAAIEQLTEAPRPLGAIRRVPQI